MGLLGALDGRGAQPVITTTGGGGGGGLGFFGFVGVLGLTGVFATSFLRALPGITTRIRAGRETFPFTSVANTLKYAVDPGLRPTLIASFVPGKGACRP